ncbi:ribosomal protein L3 [Apiospora phragmitis]|uniref:Ribosomal protein L3 n=1 Tax=Apiospora phragmitis TaxID=2905665 RepID=A0ABR1WV63_9PEZI
MASDEDYMAFLDKANKDPNEGYAKPASSGGAKLEFKTTDDGVQVPAALKEATQDAFYVSDADEPFVPVALKWDEGGKGLPDEGTSTLRIYVDFAKLIAHPNPSSANIELQDPADWDPQGQYNKLLEAVRKAGKGNDVRVYRVPKDSSRVEYWVVTTEGKGKDAKLVGVKALAVES